MKKNKPAVFGAVVIVILVFLAIFADVLFSYDAVAIKQNAMETLQPPSLQHPFGTDAYGRDLLARVVHGARVSLAIGFSATLISITLAGLLGAVSAYYGRWLDSVIMRVLDTFMCIPGMLLVLAIAAALGPGLVNMMIAIIIAMVPGFTRLIRSVILTVVGQEFIEAARASGARDHRIIIRHIIPNAIGPIIINATMNIAGIIILAAGLSYLGMGVQPPRPEWGSMLAESNNYMSAHPNMVIFPGLAIVIAALSFNLVGDGLRDALDPKLKN
jgi:peptide/nickel transport system permease protein